MTNETAIETLKELKSRISRKHFTYFAVDELALDHIIASLEEKVDVVSLAKMWHKYWSHENPPSKWEIFKWFTEIEKPAKETNEEECQRRYGMSISELGERIIKGEHPKEKECCGCCKKNGGTAHLKCCQNFIETPPFPKIELLLNSMRTAEELTEIINSLNRLHKKIINSITSREKI